MKQELKVELESLAAAAKKSGKPLQREDVVLWAEAHKESALYAEVFSEDDSEAARQRRLYLAGQLIRLYIKTIPQVNRPVCALCHLPSDQSGYRNVEDVLNNPRFRGEVLNEALAKLGRVRQSYAHLPEMDTFFNRLDGLIAEFRNELLTKMAAG